MKTRKIVPKRANDFSKPIAVSNKPIYPRITLSVKDIPEIKDWKVGETYEVELTLKQVGVSNNEYENSASFEIRAVSVEDPDEEDEEDEGEDDDNEGGA